MEWVERMNRVIDYLEANLCDTIDPEAISRIMACPYSVFNRSFAPITGIQLSEYLRRRRLSSAVIDLQNTPLRIIDIAVKYGYDSADAFTAAFKRMHGITPQEARKPDANVKFFARLTFKLMITGVEEMNYYVMEKKSFQVLGIRRTTPYGGGTWGIVKSDGSADKLAAIGGHMCDLGLCFGFDNEGNNDYMCGIEYNDAEIPGYDSYRYPDVTWLVFPAKGKLSDQVLAQTWKRIYGEFMPQSEYKQQDLPTIEKYLIWDEASDDCHVEILIPVKKQ